MTIVSNIEFLGPIEFCVHNKWHRVSALNWTKQDATVACKQLELSNTGECMNASKPGFMLCTCNTSLLTLCYF